MRAVTTIGCCVLALLFSGCGQPNDAALRLLPRLGPINSTGGADGEADENQQASANLLEALKIPFPAGTETAQAPAAAPRKTSGSLTYDFMGLEYSDGVNVSEHPGEFSEYALLSPPAGGIAWASYVLAVPLEEFEDYDRFYGFNIDVDGANIDDEDFLPPYPYWIAVANFERQRWDILGPFSDFSAQEAPGHEAAKQVYVSPAGNIHVAVISYVPPGEEPLDTTVLYLGVELTDVAPGEDPVGGEL